MRDLVAALRQNPVRGLRRGRDGHGGAAVDPGRGTEQDTVPYAIGNILLTAWGPVIVLLTR